MSAPQSNPVITDVFVEGARKGWSIATSSTLPNVVMAFIIIKALEITGALKGLGMIFAPDRVDDVTRTRWRFAYRAYETL
ncbi:hypothetical protein ACCW92_21845 [Enterobacter soli]|uniref:hypothetical protein n=1 Tax=Enterobacter soli TaxID=885040 RepID=UPI003ED8E5E4